MIGEPHRIEEVEFPHEFHVPVRVPRRFGARKIPRGVRQMQRHHCGLFETWKRGTCVTGVDELAVWRALAEGEEVVVESVAAHHDREHVAGVQNRGGEEEVVLRHGDELFGETHGGGDETVDGGEGGEVGEEGGGYGGVVATADDEERGGEGGEAGKDVLDGAVEDDVAIDVAVETAAVVSLDPLGHAGEKRQTAAVQSGRSGGFMFQILESIGPVNVDFACTLFPVFAVSK